jgi:predicted DNA-binding protein (UPF0251 family)
MGRDRAEQGALDLFSTDMVRGASSSAIKPTVAAQPVADTSTQRHVLPKNLRHALTQLSDEELDELCEVAVDEAKRRRRLRWSTGAESTRSSRRPSRSMANRAASTDKTPRRRQVSIAEVLLTRGQVNAVRAAFRAGITPSRIARQFGISQANVRKALASDEPTR